MSQTTVTFADGVLDKIISICTETFLKDKTSMIHYVTEHCLKVNSAKVNLGFNRCVVSYDTTTKQVTDCEKIAFDVLPKYEYLQIKEPAYLQFNREAKIDYNLNITDVNELKERLTPFHYNKVKGQSLSDAINFTRISLANVSSRNNYKLSINPRLGIPIFYKNHPYIALPVNKNSTFALVFSYKEDTYKLEYLLDLTECRLAARLVQPIKNTWLTFNPNLQTQKPYKTFKTSNKFSKQTSSKDSSEPVRNEVKQSTQTKLFHVSTNTLSKEQLAEQIKKHGTVVSFCQISPKAVYVEYSDFNYNLTQYSIYQVREDRQVIAYFKLMKPADITCKYQLLGSKSISEALNGSPKYNHNNNLIIFTNLQDLQFFKQSVNGIISLKDIKLEVQDSHKYVYTGKKY